MRDSRRARAIIVVASTAAIAAVLAELYIRPTLERKVARR